MLREWMTQSSVSNESQGSLVCYLLNAVCWTSWSTPTGLSDFHAGWMTSVCKCEAWGLWVLVLRVTLIVLGIHSCSGVSARLFSVSYRISHQLQWMLKESTLSNQFWYNCLKTGGNKAASVTAGEPPHREPFFGLYFLLKTSCHHSSHTPRWAYLGWLLRQILSLSRFTFVTFFISRLTACWIVTHRICLDPLPVLFFIFVFYPVLFYILLKHLMNTL